MTRALLALGAVALLVWLNVRDLLDLRGYETSHSQVTGHHPWWLHVLGHRRCGLCLLGFRKVAGKSAPDPEDDVQPPDPVTFRYVPGYTMPLTPIGTGTGDVIPQPWVNTSGTPPDPRTTRPVVITLPDSLTTDEVGHIRTWLDAHPDVITELYESEPIRSTQTGPIGPSA